MSEIILFDLRQSDLDALADDEFWRIWEGLRPIARTVLSSRSRCELPFERMENEARRTHEPEPARGVKA